MSKYIVAVLGCAAAGLSAAPSFAQAPAQNLPNVEVQQKKQKPARAVKKPVPSQEPAEAEHAHSEQGVGTQGLARPLSGTMLSGPALVQEHPAEKDAASLLSAAPGVNVFQGGAVSGLPTINGLADDRIRTELNGMLITSACANHMNPPLSFIDPGNVGRVEVNSGVASVSKGGDAIGGSISVESPLPKFATAPGELLTAATLSSFYRSNGDGVGVSASVTEATSNFSATYAGAWSKASDYHRGGDGAVVGSTDYEAQNHAVTLAARTGRDDLLIFRAAVQQIPYQGFINQFMDMGDSAHSTPGNQAYDLGLQYKGNLGWALIDANAFYHDVKHYMNFLDDKGGSTASTGMPMYTHGTDFGYGVKLEVPVSPRDKIRVGNELHAQQYNEWWPPVAGMAPWMGPNTFWNIKDGQRTRVGTFAEWESKWSPAWTTLIGARNDTVWMDTGNVAGYSDMYDADKNAFNNAKHAKTDVNFDATALVRYEPDANSNFEAGYSRKTRSPNLYERYAWSLGGASMISWFGDLNGYVGNLDLKPEVAHTASFTGTWRGGGTSPWEVKVTPYYTFVEGYIDVDLIDSNGAYNNLRFANHDAELYGVNVSGRTRLLQNAELGTVSLSGLAGYVHGQRTDTGGSLYHMMPLNARVALEDKISVGRGTWTNLVELQAVEAKTEVDTLRTEPTTPGYAIVNFRSSYQWDNFRFDAGVENLFDQLYYSPLGGADYFDYMATGSKNPVAAQGRSVYVGLTVKF
jgi:iron complex outermembrane recepter protein